MNIQKAYFSLCVFSFWAMTGQSACGQLFSEDFEVDPTANWQVNGGPVAPDLGFGPDATHDANFFFDYADVGIPLAPNSAPGETRGLKLQANNDFNSDGLGVFTGMSVSPIGQDFSSAGDYKLTFDWWANSIGPFPGGGSGSTQLSTFGIGTDGTVAQWPGGSQNSVWFAATGDGGSSADWRAYSPTPAGRFSYQEGDGTPTSDPPDGTYVYEAESTETTPVRQNTNPYYASFGSVEPPAEQTALFSQQTGTTNVGSAGFEWHAVEIAKIGQDISWTVDGTLIATVNLTDPDPITLSGGNIFFGHSDVNGTVSNDANRFDLLFTLIDNVVVEEIGDLPGLPGDFNGNMVVDAADYTVWRDNLGGTADLGGNGDETGASAGVVDEADYDLWKANFGDMAAGGGSALGAAGVPEPSAIVLCLLASAAAAGCRGRRRPMLHAR